MQLKSKSNTLKENTLNFGSFSTYRNAIYGFAAIWIVFFHGIALYNIRTEFDPSIKLISDFFCMGNIGVDVFVFLSGISLYFSYSKKPKLMSFYYKRIVRVYIPYLIMTLPYIIYYFVNQEIDVGLMIRAITTVNFWTGESEPIDFWYISVILVLYLLYPLIFKFIFRQSAKSKMPQEKAELIRMIILAVSSFALSLIIFFCFPQAYLVVDRALSRLTVFIIGAYIGKLVKEKKPFHESLLIISLIVIAGAFPLYVDPSLTGVWWRYYGSLTGIALVFVLSQLFTLLSTIRFDRVFAFLGAFSLEIYLLSLIGRKIYINTPWYTDGYAFLHYVIAMLISIFVAWLVSQIEKPLFRLLLRQKKK